MRPTVARSSFKIPKLAALWLFKIFGRDHCSVNSWQGKKTIGQCYRRVLKTLATTRPVAGTNTWRACSDCCEPKNSHAVSRIVISWCQIAAQADEYSSGIPSRRLQCSLSWKVARQWNARWQQRFVARPCRRRFFGRPHAVPPAASLMRAVTVAAGKRRTLRQSSDGL